MHKKKALKKREKKREKSSSRVRFQLGRKSRLGLKLPIFRESRQQHTSKQGGLYKAPQAIKAAIGKKVVGSRLIKCYKKAKGSRRKEE